MAFKFSRSISLALHVHNSMSKKLIHDEEDTHTCLPNCESNTATKLLQYNTIKNNLYMYVQ